MEFVVCISVDIQLRTYLRCGIEVCQAAADEVQPSAEWTGGTAESTNNVSGNERKKSQIQVVILHFPLRCYVIVRYYRVTVWCLFRDSYHHHKAFCLTNFINF